VVWDPDERFVVHEDGLFFRHKVSPYLGMALLGRVHQTILRGAPVFDGNQHPGGPQGRLLLHRDAAAGRPAGGADTPAQRW
jgi:hypothetical protein